MTYNAIVFDLDGTLLNTLEDLADSTNRMLQTLGFPEHAVDAYRYFVGNGMAKLIENVLPEAARTKAVMTQALQLFQENYQKNWKNNTRPYEQVPDMLDRLQEKGITFTILSNKPDAFTQRCVAELLPQWHFEIVQGQKAGIPRKPDPAGALDIARTLALHPNEFFYLGDTATDMKTAVAAGMFPGAALWGFREREELLEHGAQQLFECPLDVSDFLL
ncbi:HAD family hydrolase [candidate division KSB3 bacterium]|uniref:HAD family hydrolase n=1 Tax=candidate division KSB3 bacterium TaxID=2044937 RepID=A0A2G6E5B0_9BACT|nr:MAG: HAD family hydrolase [candidate division KSB3 bacterium]PIE29841.1 MAG: HAD family hydrolase [candidate division KSB3 bacterium]